MSREPVVLFLLGLGLNVLTAAASFWAPSAHRDLVITVGLVIGLGLIIGALVVWEMDRRTHRSRASKQKPGPSLQPRERIVLENVWDARTGAGHALVGGENVQDVGLFMCRTDSGSLIDADRLENVTADFNIAPGPMIRTREGKNITARHNVILGWLRRRFSTDKPGSVLDMGASDATPMDDRQNKKKKKEG